ncbi:UPF0280 family protein [uncultured Methanobrevibacter sp.]|uniref:UPF0280 family protein n=1 Tax=uncultured Methanobrevibacter sp. TaxID=253161 RepID=UPI00260269C4|nr:UPF0280 family protein [uncultured Methanobrevibacter sp.]
MESQHIDLNQTHIRLTTDLKNNNLKNYILKLRTDLEHYILKHEEFQISLEPLTYNNENLSEIIKKMYVASNCCDVGPMATVAGTISEMSLDYLISKKSKYSIIENGGDIAIINNKPSICGIYSNNPILGNKIGFKLKKRKKPLGICTSSGKIGHSISFGQSDSVTILSKKASIADGLATRIANEIIGETSEDKVYRGLEVSENYKEFFEGALIISQDHIGTIGTLPKIIETKEFKIKV